MDGVDLVWLRLSVGYLLGRSRAKWFGLDQLISEKGLDCCRIRFVGGLDIKLLVNGLGSKCPVNMA